ncbi:MAG TPA: type II asparaginase [Victivallales bacterium]|nr:type II asparaginase [Victivallales bacterium]
MLPKIMILGTGGTIAGTAENANKTVGYESGKLDISSIIDSVPGINSMAKIQYEQVFNFCSRRMKPENWVILAKNVQKYLDEDFDGVVITHGTNTLEETAYFLHLTVKTEKPVVITCAMRPATAISADGPMNIYQAVKVASNKNSWSRGVLAVINDRLFCARDVSKGSTTNPDTMNSQNTQIIGTIEGNQIFYNFSSDKLHTFKSEFNIRDIDALPKVDVVYNYAGAGRELVDCFINNDSKGIVSAGVGNGAFTDEILAGFKDASEKGIFVVRSSRAGSGHIIRNGDEKDNEYNFIVSNDLNPQKARVLLVVALTKTDNLQKIQKIFDEY